MKTNHCIFWDTTAANKPQDKTKKDLMTAKGLDREEGIRDTVLFRLINKQDFHAVNTSPAPVPRPSVSDNSSPGQEKSGIWAERAFLLVLQPWRGMAVPAP